MKWRALCLLTPKGIHPTVISVVLQNKNKNLIKILVLCPSECHCEQRCVKEHFRSCGLHITLQSHSTSLEPDHMAGQKDFSKRTSIKNHIQATD